MTWVHPTAYISPGVELGDRVVVGPHATLDGAGQRIIIGSRCVIGPGARIGQAGFGYEYEADGYDGATGEWVTKPHLFGVILEAGVHVGANACIDRGSWRDTRIGAGTKIDNLVHVAHNVVTGRDCLIVAHAELSGSVTLGHRAYIAPRACIRERLTIGEGAVVGLGAVVVKDVAEHTTVAGVPARMIGPADGPPPPPRGRE